MFVLPPKLHNFVTVSGREKIENQLDVLKQICPFNSVSFRQLVRLPALIQRRKLRIRFPLGNSHRMFYCVD